jgi:hypothetical protein
VTVTKLGFGVSAGMAALLDAELVMVGVSADDDTDDDFEVDDEDEDTEALLEDVALELVAIGFGAGSITVAVTSCVTVGPGLTTSTVFVDLISVVACATWVDPPSTLMIE